jgi:hypothetical protein
MNRSKTIRSEAECVELDGRIDGILAAEDELIPSSGFLASVMERVQEEAAAPAPIPFPWKRTVPGLLAIAGLFGWGGYDLMRLSPPAWSSSIPLPVQLTAISMASAEQAGWMALALGLTLLCWLLSRRLVRRGGLL